MKKTIISTAFLFMSGAVFAGLSTAEKLALIGSESYKTTQSIRNDVSPNAVKTYVESCWSVAPSVSCLFADYTGRHLEHQSASSEKRTPDEFFSKSNIRERSDTWFKGYNKMGAEYADSYFDTVESLVKGMSNMGHP